MTTRTSVRRLRKSLGLGQRDLATLLGVTQSAVSRIESGSPADSDHLFGLQVLFGEPASTLFPGRFEAIAEEIARRAAELERSLQRRHDRHTVHKRAWLRAMIGRITVRPA